MKYTKSVLTALAVLLGAFLFAACDKFSDDVQPASMSQLKVNDDFYKTEKNQGVYLDVLANDTIGNLTTIQFAPTQHGTLQPDSVPGLLYYMPNQNYTGTESFTYQACINNTCATATVRILIKPDSVITPPCIVIANNDFASVTENIPYIMPVIMWQ